MSTDPKYGFYYEGKKVTVEDFIDDYSREYFFPSKKDAAVKGIIRSSYYAEAEITKLLDRKILVANFKMNLIKIMAWKLGGIDREKSESEDQKKCVLKWDYDESSGKLKTKEIRRGNYKPIDGQELDAFLDGIVADDELLKKENDWKTIYQRLAGIHKERPVNNLGVTYLLTLLYFLTEGACPIYDKFAQMALFAIKNDINPFLNGNEKPPVEYSVPGIHCVSRDYGIYYTFKRDLDLVFDYSSKVNDKEFLRKVDQALWVYGHKFSSDNQ